MVPKAASEEAAPAGAAPGKTALERLERLADGVKGAILSMRQAATYHIVAVLPLRDRAIRAREKDVGEWLGYWLRNELSRYRDMQLVPLVYLREAISDVDAPDGRSLTTEELQTVAEAVGADTIVRGWVSHDGSHFEVQVSVLAPGASKDARQTTLEMLPDRDLLELMREWAVVKTRWKALAHSFAPGAGQFYLEEYGKGGVFLGSAVALAATGIVFGILGSRAEARYQQPVRITVGERETANTYYDAANGLYAAAGIVWVWSAVDAFLSGHDPDQDPARVDLRPISAGLVPDGIPAVGLLVGGGF